MTVTQRDVQRIAEMEDFTREATRVLDEFRQRAGLNPATKERGKDAAAAVAEADARLRALRKTTEAVEDVRL